MSYIIDDIFDEFNLHNNLSFRRYVKFARVIKSEKGEHHICSRNKVINNNYLFYRLQILLGKYPNYYNLCCYRLSEIVSYMYYSLVLLYMIYLIYNYCAMITITVIIILFRRLEMYMSFSISVIVCFERLINTKPNEPWNLCMNDFQFFEFICNVNCVIHYMRLGYWR